MHLNHLLGVLLESFPNVIYSLQTIRKVFFITQAVPLNCGCFVVALYALQNPPLPNGSFCSLNSTVIGNLDHDKRSMSNVYKYTTVVAAWVVSIFPSLIMSATDRLRGENLLGLDEAPLPLATFGGWAGPSDLVRVWLWDRTISRSLLLILHSGRQSSMLLPGLASVMTCTLT